MSAPTVADEDPTTSPPPRPPLIAMVVVGVVGVVILALFLRSAGLATGSVAESILDEGESIVEAGPVTLEVGDVTLTGTLDHDWILRERCDGWVQLNSLEDGDATTVHVIATSGAPDMTTRTLVAVTDYPAWLATSAGIRIDDAAGTRLLGQPAVAGRLVADAGADEAALLAACRESDGSGGSGIRGPAAGFDQYLVATTGPVDGLGSVLVLGAAWVGGDPDLAADEADGLASSLVVVDQ